MAARARRWIGGALFATLCIGALAWTSLADPTGNSTASIQECPALATAPWLTLSEPVDSEAIPGVAEFLDSVVKAYSDEELSGTWFSEVSGSLALVVGIVNPTNADLQAIAEMADSDGLKTIQLVVQAVPLGLDELSVIQAKVDALLSEDGFEFTSTGRPDAGVVEVGVRGVDPIEVQTVLDGVAEPCQISTYKMADGDRYQAMVGRNDQPPYKAGKRIHVFIPYGGSGELGQQTTCTAGFVFEQDGSGTQPLYGSAAGHCSQFDNLHQDVYDDHDALDVIALTQSPNLFRANSPAVGDAVLFDLVFSRANTDMQIIINSSTQRTVIGRKTPSQLGLGTSICHSGAAGGDDERCGAITDLDRTVSFQYQDYSTNPPTTSMKSVQNNVCFNAATQVGDSGAGYYQKSGSNNAYAVAILSSGTGSNTCGTPVGVVTSNTGTHLWLG